MIPDVPIVDLVLDCETWDPTRNGKGHFRYIDLSSVAKDLKEITTVESIPCSDAPSRARQLVQTDDVLIATVRPNLNGVALVAQAHHGATASTGYTILRSNPERLEPRYLFHWVRTPTFVDRMVAVATGASYPAVSDAKVKNSTIPLPPLPAQKRVAAILDAANALRAKRRESLEHFDALVQSVFLDMFGDPVTNPKGWDERTLGEVCEVQGGLQVSRKRNDLPLERPYLRVANVYRGRLELGEIKMIRLTSAEAERTRLLRDDLLVVEGHGNPDEIGRCARWDGSLPDCVHQNHLIRVRCQPTDILPPFLESYLNSPGGRRGLLRSARTTSGLNTISVSKVRAAFVQTPPLEKQQEFVEILEAIHHSRSRSEAHLAELDTLFASLQARAFRGEL